MGATNTYDSILIKGTARDAFKRLQAEAEAEYGHQQGYSGQIHCIEDFTIVKDHPRVDTHAWTRWVREKNEGIPKREALCVEMHPALVKKIKEKEGLKGRKGIRGFVFIGCAPE